MTPQSLADVRTRVRDALAHDDVATALDAIRPHARALAAETGAEFRDLLRSLPEDSWTPDATLVAALSTSYRSADPERGPAAQAYLYAAASALEGAGRERDADRAELWLASATVQRTAGRLDAAQELLDRVRGLDAPGGSTGISARVSLGARLMLEQGILHIHRGAFDEARRALAFTVGLAEDGLTRAEHLEALGGLAMLDYVDGDLAAGLERIALAHAVASGTDLLASPHAGAMWGAHILIAIEQGDLATARSLEEPLGRAVADSDFAAFSYHAASYLRLADGRFAEALDALQRARHLFRGWSTPSYASDAGQLLRAGILVALDRGEEAWAILASLDPYPRHQLCPARIVAQLRLLHGDLRGASDAIEPCEAMGDDHAPRTLVDVRLMRAAIDMERGETAVADLAFERALVALARTGARSPLRMVPPGTLGALAARAAARPTSPEVASVLAEIAASGDDSARVAPLTPPELLVLAEVEKGSTVAAIAAALYLSPNTVKTHLRRLYRKLGVSTRSEAIRKAKSLGLGSEITR